MPDDGHPLDVEYAEQVAHAVGVGRYRIVGAGFIGFAVPQQVWGDDGESLGQLGVDCSPGGGVVADAVNQQDWRTGPGDSESSLISVDGAELQRRRSHFPHRVKVALPLGHLANLVVGPTGALSTY